MNAETYCHKVISGEILVCTYVKQVCEKHLSDLERDFEFEFLPERGKHVIRFIEQGLIQYRDKFKNKPLLLAPWQHFALYMMFGWVSKQTGKRRYRYVYIEVGRKNGKSTWAGAVGLYELAFNKAAPEVVTAATGKKQARIVLDEARKLARNSPKINAALRVREHDIIVPGTHGKMEAVAANDDKLDGLGPSVVILDELHAHKTFGMFNTMDTGLGARTNPLMLSISTAGLHKANPAYAYRKYLIDIIEGRVIAEDHFSLIFATDEGDDWKSEEALHKANPSWGISINPDYLLKQLEKARSNPAFETDYRSKHLNEWVDAEKCWISDTDWMKCTGDPVPYETLKNVPCWGGLDIGRVADLTAMVLIFKIGENYVCKSWFWIPEAKVRSKEDIVDYWQWKEAGLIRVIDGNMISSKDLVDDIYSIIEKYKVQSLAYDRWFAGDVIERLLDKGFPLTSFDKFDQSFKNFSPPIRKLEELILSQRLNHEGNEVLRWMASNVVVQVDGGGSIRFSKEKSIDRIDGMVALGMAVGTEMSEDKPITGNVRFLN